MNRLLLVFMACSLSLTAVVYGVPAYLVIYSNHIWAVPENPIQRLVGIKQSQGFNVITAHSELIYYTYPNLDYQDAVKEYIHDIYSDPECDLKYVLIISANDETAPAQWINLPVIGSAGSYADDWYVDFSSDDLVPEVAIGRLPFVDGYELHDYLDKLEAYELHRAEGWCNNVTICMDDVNRAGVYSPPGMTAEGYYQVLYDFAAYLASCMEPDCTVDQLRRSDFSVPYFEYRSRINAGRGLTVYLGSGTWEGFGGLWEDLRYAFITSRYGKVNSVGTLSNSDKYPFFFYPVCVSGELGQQPYRYPTGTPTISECLNFIDGKGAIGTLGPIDWCLYNRDTRLFTRFLIDEILQYGSPVGDAVKEAKRSYRNQCRENPNLVLSMELYCDPSLELCLPSRDYFPLKLSGFPIILDDYSYGLSTATLYPPPGQGLPGENPPYHIPGDAPKDVAFLASDAVRAYDAGGRCNFASPSGGDASNSIIADINADGLFEIIVYRPNKILVYDNYGNFMPGFPIDITENIGSAPAVGDINGDGYLDIVVATDTKVHVINYDGTEFTGGWPANLQTDYWPVGSPAVGDIDYDGNLEVVVGTSSSSHNSNISVFDKNGNVKSGWAYPAGFLGYELITPPALADLTGDGPLEIVVASTKYPYSPRKGYYHVFSHNGTELVDELLDGYSFDFTPSVGEFIPWPEYPGKEAVLVGYNGYDSDILLIEADDGSVENTIFTNGKFVTSAPTIGDVDDFGANEVVVGCEDYLMAYCLDWGGVPFDGEWDGSLNGAVSTPIITDLNGDGLSDILCGDSDGVYAFTTDRMYLPLTGFDWIRENHDNMNMGLWDIAAPTGVVAEDIPNDQGGSVVVAWSHSVDVGVRSSRVAKYKIYRKAGDIIPPGGDAGPVAGGAVRRKLAEGKRTAALSDGAVISRASLSADAPSPARLADTGETTDDLFVHIATVLPPDYYYVDEGLDNLRTYEYHVVATDYDETYRSQPSVTVSVVPHDNIAPAPPTNFDLDIIHGQPPAVILTWTRSFDDPMYHSGQGEPTDTTRGRVIAGRFVPPGVASPVPAGRAVPAAGGSAAASAAAYDGGAGASGAYAGAPGAPSFLSDKQGEAAKMKFASRRGLADNYGTTGPRPSAPTDGGFDDGADDVSTYIITKDQEIFECYPVTPGNDVEYLDEEVSYGNMYYYWIKAKDSENYSEEVGPIIADLTYIPDAGPLAYGPDSPLAGDPYGGAVDGGAAAASPYAEMGRGACGTKPAKVITCKPNPVTGTATFTITLPAACPVKLDVYDLAGRRVDMVLRKTVREGGETVLWQPAIPTGVYIYRLETPKRQYSGKVVVAR